MSKSITEIFSDIDAYLFRYKEEAQQKYGNSYNVDEDEHIGVMAQELLNNPLTESTVNTEGEELTVNTDELVMVLTAVMSDMAKEIKEIKERLDNLEGVI